MKSSEVHFSVCLRDDHEADPTLFHEDAVPYDMRCKDFFSTRPDDHTLVVDWQTEECESSHGLPQFKTEAERWAAANGVKGSGVVVKFKLSTRGGVEWKAKFEVK